MADYAALQADASLSYGSKGVEEKRAYYDILRGQLEVERATFWSHWKDLDTYISPRRARFFVTDVNKGDRRNREIINSTGSIAVRTLANGMMSGLTSPGRPWFRLTTTDPDLGEASDVKEWLYQVTKILGTAMLRTNQYKELFLFYKQLATYGTAALFLEEDPERVLFFRMLPLGSYYCANDGQNRVRTFMRRMQITVQQIIDLFGRKGEDGQVTDWSNISPYVKNLWDNKMRASYIEITHVITPNEDWNPESLDPTKKRYSSCYYESGGAESAGQVSQPGGGYTPTTKFLRESGYDYFPVIVARWEVTDGDVYGTDCPGMMALGDIRQLQVMERQKARAIEKIVDPPMNADGANRSVRLSTLSGDINYLNKRAGDTGFAPAYQITFRTNELVEDIAKIEFRINEAFYKQLVLAILSDDRSQRATAEEIREAVVEKLGQFGSVLEQLNWDAYDPLIDVWFALGLRAGLIPPPPAQLQGQVLKVEYISIMAQAQKAQGVSAINSFMGIVVPMGQIFPRIIKKIDPDVFVDELGEGLGVPPQMIRSKDEVDEIEAADAAAIAQQRQLVNTQATSEIAKNLGTARVTPDTALGQLSAATPAGPA